MKTIRTNNLISLNEFCFIHNIKISFISLLEQNRLIEIITQNETAYIDINDLHQLEKIVWFYFDLNINLEGIETITHLLQRINTMHDEIIALKNTLRLHELRND